MVVEVRGEKYIVDEWLDGPYGDQFDYLAVEILTLAVKKLRKEVKDKI